MGILHVHAVRWTLVFVLGLCVVAPVEAQRPSTRPGQSIQFERLEGLSHNTVLAILQDQQGFLWVGTADGLNRYDGYEFVVYRHLPSDSTSLIDNTVQTLAEDPSGDLWVGTAGGLDRLDRATGQFEHYDLTPGRLDAPKNVAQVVLDGAGHLWVTTYLESGLYRYNRSTRAFKRYVPGEGVENVNTLEVDSAGRLWIVGGGGSEASAAKALYRYDEEQDQVQQVTALQSASLHAGRSGTLWIGGEQSKALDAKNAPLRRIAAPIPWGQERNKMYETRDGMVWIGTGQGLFRFNPATEALQYHAVDTSGTAGLSNYIWTLYEDRAGILWVGTRSGLYRYDPHRKPFGHLGPATGVLHGAGESAVMAVREDAGEDLWVGTLGGGLAHLRRENGTFRPSEARYALPSDQVWALHQDRQGALWIGTEAGVCTLDRTSGRCTEHVLPAPFPDSSTPVYTFADHRQGPLWMGGIELYRYDLASGQVDTPVPIEYGQDFTTIQALHVDQEGRLWIGMESGGLGRYEPTSGRYVSYPVGGQDTGLLGTTVWTIHESTDGLLWLGTDVGLARLDPATDSITHYFDSDRLPGSIVYSILEDEQHRLWLGTNQGLVRFDPRTERFRRFDASDGVRNAEFNRRAAFRSKRGRFFFGGLRGITTFDPEAIRDNPYVPPVVITKITKVDGTEPVSLNPYGREEIVLDYRDRVFTFEFAALNFTNPEKNRYTYQLDGFEDGWVEAGTRRIVRYTNVPPGEYVFRVRGANNDGVWNEAGTSVRVTITPPFWQTGWFRLLVGILIVGALVLAYRIRVRHLLKVERLRLRIASDLHDDIGSRLASVAITSDMLRTQADLGEAERTEVRHIGTVVRETAETLRDIVWFVDPEHDDPEALLWKMKNEASTLLNGLDYQFDHPAPERLAGLEQLNVRARRNLFLIYKEALHDVVQHAQAQTVRITLHHGSGELVLTIADDGVGFDPDDATQWGHGLKNMRRRAEQMNADLTLTSRPDRGTTLRLTVPVT